MIVVSSCSFLLSLPAPPHFQSGDAEQIVETKQSWDMKSLVTVLEDWAMSLNIRRAGCSKELVLNGRLWILLLVLLIIVIQV